MAPNTYSLIRGDEFPVDATEAIDAMQTVLQAGDFIGTIRASAAAFFQIEDASYDWEYAL